jgi:hypothetical protein
MKEGLLAKCLLGLLFSPEGGTQMLLQNVHVGHLLDLLSYPRRQYSSTYQSSVHEYCDESNTIKFQAI